MKKGSRPLCAKNANCAGRDRGFKPTEGQRHKRNEPEETLVDVTEIQRGRKRRKGLTLAWGRRGRKSLDAHRAADLKKSRGPFGVGKVKRMNDSKQNKTARACRTAVSKSHIQTKEECRPKS